MGKSELDKEKRAGRSKNEKKPLKTGGKSNQEAGGDVGMGAAVEKTEQGEKKASKKGEKKAPNQGAKKALRKAVKRAVRERSKQIADSLVDHTVEGDIRSAEMVITLMEDKKKEGEDDKPWTGPSVAEMLASEPEWDEEMEAKEKARTRE